MNDELKRKYELLTDQTKEFHNGTVYRIQALKDINDCIKKGDIGGWVSSENNLSHPRYKKPTMQWRRLLK